MIFSLLPLIYLSKTSDFYYSQRFFYLSPSVLFYLNPLFSSVSNLRLLHRYVIVIQCNMYVVIEVKHPYNCVETKRLLCKTLRNVMPHRPL